MGDSEGREGAAHGPQLERLIALREGEIPEEMTDLRGWVERGCEVRGEARSNNLRIVNLAATAMAFDVGGVPLSTRLSFERQLAEWLADDETEWCQGEQGSNVYGHLYRTALHHLADLFLPMPLHYMVWFALSRFAEWYRIAGDTCVGLRCRRGPYPQEYHYWMRGDAVRKPANLVRGNRQTLWALTDSWRTTREPGWVWPAQHNLRVRVPVEFAVVDGVRCAMLVGDVSGYTAPGVQWFASEDGEYRHSFVRHAESTPPWTPDMVVGGVDRSGVRGE